MLVLHVGTQKTGSSSIQHFLRENQDRFRLAGVNFVSAIRNWIDHNELARELRGGSENLPRLQAVVDELAMNPDAINIVSAEELFHARVPARLAQLLPQDIIENTKIVVYLRRPDHLMEALYKQRLKTGAIKPDPLAYLNKSSWEYDYLTVLEEFEKYFGRQALVVRPYTRSMLKDGDVVSDFLETIGVNLTEDFTRALPEDNPTFSASVSELMGFCCRNTTIKFYDINNKIAKLDWPNIRKSGDVYTLDQRLHLMKLLERDLLEICERFGEDLSSCLSFDDLKSSNETYPSDAERAALNLQAGKAVVFAMRGFVSK